MARQGDRIKITDSGLCEKVESGDVLTVWALSRSAGWAVTVRRVTIMAIIQRTVEPIVARVHIHRCIRFQDYQEDVDALD